MAVVTIKNIRDFLMDYANENMKHLDMFFKNEQIEFAIDMANDLVDKTPPLGTGVTHANIPIYTMIQGVSAILIQLKLNNIAINSTQGVVEHGVQLGIGDEYTLLKDVQNTLLRTFSTSMRDYKKAVDFSNALGTLTSPMGSSRGCGGRELG